MKFKLIFASLALLISQSVLAEEMPNKPSQCPGVKAIKSVGITEVYLNSVEDNGWVGIQSHSNYDTKENWGFVIGKFVAKDAKEAFDKAQLAIGGLQLVNGPYANEALYTWECEYQSKEGYQAFAITPSPFNLRSLLHR